jgi:hypothetical protein
MSQVYFYPTKGTTETSYIEQNLLTALAFWQEFAGPLYGLSCTPEVEISGAICST